MSRPCPTCDGEGVIRSEETIAIEFERKLRDEAAEHPEAEAFLVQMNPRVSTQFTGHGSPVLHTLEEQTGKSFLFEGSEGLGLDHFAITFMGTREEVEERALPFRQGDEVLVEIVEPHMYDVDDAVAKIDGYIISIAGAAPYVGEKRMVRIHQVGRTAASALLLDESGEVITAPERTPAAARGGRPRAKRRSPSTSRESKPAGARDTAGNGEDAKARREPSRKASTDGARPRRDAALAASADASEGDVAADGKPDDLQSKPRRRGRRGGRRRSAAKARASTE